MSAGFRRRTRRAGCGRKVDRNLVARASLLVAVALAFLLAGLIPTPAVADAPALPEQNAVVRARSQDLRVAAVLRVGFTVADLDRSVAFFTDVLGFEQTGEREEAGDAIEARTGVFAARVRTARLRLGREEIELSEFLAPSTGRPIPVDSQANDLWFQHVAIVVSDLDAAYARLRAHRVRHASAGPQRLPDWNPDAGGIEAFYFRDPDGHFLELIEYPKGKGDPRWQRAEGRLFLGIDHTAIAVADTDRSLAWYRDRLGLRVAGTSENFGIEQERLNGVFGARLRITALRAAAPGPGIELLEYLAPSTGRPRPRDLRAHDLAYWHVDLRLAEDVRPTDGLPSADPDGHALRFLASQAEYAKSRRQESPIRNAVRTAGGSR